MDQFTALAKYYDRFVGADYDKMADFIDHKIKEFFPSASLVCDIGCGSGTLTLALLEKGYDMIGIDGSVEMLSEAINKRTEVENGEKALFLCQQLPEFELYGTVDCVVSTLDTLNYLTETTDLERSFHWFNNYLNPNGLLIFDINSLSKYQDVLDGHCAVYDEEDVFMTWHSRFEENLCRHKLSVFSKSGNSYQRSDEEQIQRYYSVEYIRELLNKYHFKLVCMVDDYSDNLPVERSQRLTFVAIKEN